MFSSGTLFVIAGPSGAGKTTLAHHLVDTFEKTVFSVSSTTRSPRGEEVNGRDYFFISDEEFRRRVDESFFLEWAEVHGRRYGTSGEWVREKLSKGFSVVLDIDVQGAMQVKRAVPSAVLIFVLPRSREILLKRLRGRNTDTAETVAGRMEAAAGEVAALGSFDYFIQNGELHRARVDIENIHRAETMRLSGLGWPESAGEYFPGLFSGLQGWQGRSVVVSSGPTREMIDDVRFVSNRSSGRMGVCLAEAFLAAGARVTLVSGPASVMDPPGAAELVRVQSAAEMKEALTERTRGADLLVMAAAVSDYRPAEQNRGKLKRGFGPMSLELIPTEDILASLNGGFKTLAFALEYGDRAGERAMAKLRSKGADAIFLNRGDLPGQGMEAWDNSGTLFFADDPVGTDVPSGSKKFVAFCLAAALGRRFQP